MMILVESARPQIRFTSPACGWGKLSPLAERRADEAIQVPTKPNSSLHEESLKRSRRLMGVIERQTACVVASLFA